MNNQELRQAAIDKKHRTDIFFILYSEGILRREVWGNGYGNVLKDTQIVAPQGRKAIETYLKRNSITEVIEK